MCLKPVTLTHKACDRWYREFTVPCGKCEECVKDQQNEYVIRTVEEQKKRGSVVFITLTYNEGSVPRFNDDGEIDEETGEIIVEPFEYRGLNRADVVAWKKRVCQHYYNTYGIRLDFSYLICGEYGPRTHRPHYHGILLGLNQLQAKFFQEDWERNYGFTCFKYVPTIKSDVVKVARYCSKYICKLKEFDTMPSVHAERPRKLTSLGYGMPAEDRWKKMKDFYLARNFIDYDPYEVRLSPDDTERLVEEIIKRRRYNLDGNSYKLPNYYRKKIFYVKDPLTGNDRASSIQRVVSVIVQRNAEQDFMTELQELKTVYNLGTLKEANDRYNMIHEAEFKARKEAIRQNNLRYLKKAKVQ